MTKTTYRSAVHDGIRDAMAVDDRVLLMGEDVPSRREFIETNAQYVQNLDV